MAGWVLAAAVAVAVPAGVVVARVLAVLARLGRALLTELAAELTSPLGCGLAFLAGIGRPTGVGVRTVVLAVFVLATLYIFGIEVRKLKA